MSEYLDISELLNDSESKHEIIASTDLYSIQFSYKEDLYDSVDPVRYIKAIERLVRTSPEYIAFLAIMKGNFNINKCSLLSNLQEVSIELHHYPFNLYDIVEIVLEKNFQEKKTINTFSIAKEVLSLHFENKIGLVPLSKTMHELAHSGKIFLGSELIFGEYQKFIEQYKPFISNLAIEKIKKIETLGIDYSVIEQKEKNKRGNT